MAHDPADSRADRQVQLVFDLAPTLVGVVHGQDFRRRLAARMREGEDSDRSSHPDLASEILELGGGCGDTDILELPDDPGDLVVWRRPVAILVGLLFRLGRLRTVCCC